MKWRPTSRVDTAKRRADMLAKARDFFAQRGVLEVDTPALSRAAVSDPHIESLEARMNVDRGTPFYLRTSPEFCMKRLLCAGWPDIVEIGKVWRDNEVGKRHQPEFTMIEWYRLNFGLGEIIEDTVDFLSAMIEPRHLPLPAQMMEYREAFERFAGVDPMEAPIARLAAACEADEELRTTIGEHRDGWLDLALATRIAPQFATDRLTVLRHYPQSQAALARLCPDDPSVADRFEIFLGDRELANGYVELQNPAEQAQRIEYDQQLRRRMRQPVRPRDDHFMAALQSGLPPCAGVAVGFDRLLMINEMTDDIREVQTFPFNQGSDNRPPH